MKKKIMISPSLMCADLLNIDKEIKIFEKEGIDLLHIDIMDGHYVPNFSLGPGFCSSIADDTSIPLDIHLMIENVDAFLPLFTNLKKTWISFHPEIVYHPLRTIASLKNNNIIPGIAVSPSVPIEQIKHLLPEVEYVCIMTVNPGYSGQEIIPSILKKILEMKTYCQMNNIDIKIEIDGNVSWENIPTMIKYGADILVAGTSSIFQKNNSLTDNINRLKLLIAENNN